MSALTALLAAALWGTGDFFGGFAARHSPARLVAFVSQLSGVALALLAAPFLWGEVSRQDLTWGFVGGIAGGLAVMVLYQGFQRGRISLTSPIAAVGTAVFPAAFGLARGDIVTALQLVGGLTAIVAIWILASGGDDDGSVRASVVFGLGAGLGFALLLIGLGQVQTDALGPPLLASKIGGAVGLVVPTLATRSHTKGLGRGRRPAILAGVGAVAGNLAFLSAGADENLAIASVLAALFPAFTVGLAVAFLGERLDVRRTAGLILALVGIAVIVA